MTSAYIDKYFEVQIECPKEGWYKTICKCTHVTIEDGVTWFSMVSESNYVHKFTAANIIRPVFPKAVPKYKIGDVVYADVSNQAGFSYDWQENCQITGLKVFFDKITYDAIVVGSGQKVFFYASDIYRLAKATPPPPTPEERVKELKERERWLLQQLDDVQLAMYRL